jgi:hypothetical protein
MLTAHPAGRADMPPLAGSKVTYGYLLRVPIVIGALFVALPFLARWTRAASLLIALFDVSGIGVWAVSTSAFMLTLALMTNWFLVVAYSDARCGIPSFHVSYPVRWRWYVLASIPALPTLWAVFTVGGASTTAFVVSCLAGWGTSIALYAFARWLVQQLDRIGALDAVAAWLARHPELGAGYVDLDRSRFLPGHRLAASLMLLSAGVYVFIGWQMNDPDGFAVPTLAYALLLLIIACWVLGALAFFLDRYRVPSGLPLALLIVATGFRGGSDHYFQLKPSWASTPVAPAVALAAHRPGTPARRSAIVVAANGGGIQAAAWTARVLTGLEEACRAQLGDVCRFSESIRLISAVSGGAVGAMYVASAYTGGVLPDNGELQKTLERAERSSLERVGWGLLYRDLFRPLYPHFDYDDRGSALEDAWQRDVDLSAPLESWRDDVVAGLRPATIFNATISDSGERLLMGTANPPEASGRRNFEQVFPLTDLSIVTAARLSAAFAYVSPAARADNDEENSIHFVDGGYYDVYGVASLIDWLDEALSANQQGASKIDRVLVLQLRGEPPDQAPKGKRRGWFYQVYAPVAALLGVRDTGQLAHNDEEISLLRRAWKGRVASSSAVFQFCGDSPPLSWHLTQTQKNAISSQWSEERNQEGTRAVLEFLSVPDAGADRPAADPVFVMPRCAVTPAQSGGSD